MPAAPDDREFAAIVIQGDLEDTPVVSATVMLTKVSSPTSVPSAAMRWAKITIKVSVTHTLPDDDCRTISRHGNVRPGLRAASGGVDAQSDRQAPHRRQQNA